MDYWLGAKAASPAPTLRKVIPNPLKQFKNLQKKFLKTRGLPSRETHVS
jgi:hypothetical protein